MHWRKAGVLDVNPNKPWSNYVCLSSPTSLLLHTGTETQDSQREIAVRALMNLPDFLAENLRDWETAN
ncbi:hypothetical protein B0H10DRAFT_2220140 [Mycena sp. CBHHK59/15]|nr:hypothetical protein B0H10DRAFT_2220140 [Mycena sp. CBHHK59/15]